MMARRLLTIAPISFIVNLLFPAKRHVVPREPVYSIGQAELARLFVANLRAF